ncbi:UPF0182 family protein [Oscillatoria sp. CS-180]|uniref:UPF0182 family protein n=1 Tax=Oscillatoria sp. CS-180 TaxID=3021720 RepID=UPI00232EC3CC|nr:UPF0182 family protein [Oscillatoria sp. CS-180]MDB9529088.1 UPF0182 family protein [Oscillatoria sp. CS-180]
MGMLEKRLQHWSGWIWLIAIALGFLLFWGITYFWAEGLWFRDVGYSSVFQLRLVTQVLLGLIAGGLSILFLWVNLRLTTRFPPPPISPTALSASDQRSRSPGIGLFLLLALSNGLALVIGIQMLYLGRVVSSYWSLTSSVYNPAPPLPLWAKPDAIQAVFVQLVAYPLQLVALLFVAIAFIFLPRLCTAIAAVFTGVALGVVLSEQWTKVLTAINPVTFGSTDPLFERDISYYLFRLPFLEVLEFWFISLIFFALASVTLLYLLSGNSLSNGRFPGFSPKQQRHLYGLSGVLLLATSLNHWLGRYEILYSPQGVVYGASYTDVNVGLPVYTVLSVMALLLGIAMLWRTLYWSVGVRDVFVWMGKVGQRKHAGLPPLSYRPLSARPLIWGLGIYILLAIAGGLIVPRLVQQVVVQPNELQRERPYIERAIALTRQAFDLYDINVQPFDPEGDLTIDDLQSNRTTLDNVRLWDTRPLLQSNRQLQQIRLYYEFSDADVDRYPLIQDSGETSLRQVLISARELNFERVPEVAKTWVNEHLVYTHGYGFTMSPVNTANEDGLPSYFVKDIDHTPSDEAVRRSIPIDKPRIYFGELTNTYVMVDTDVRELDFPSGDDNAYNTYDGSSGVAIANPFQRLLFAWHLKDWKMLFTEDFNENTRLLFRRRITDRVQSIAPFLRFDSDPYLVIADIEEDTRSWGTNVAFRETIPPSADANYLYWVIDAYTTSDRYPYSDPLSNDFNYIRNSVKVVIDAYNGAVRFYMTDVQDPIIQTWDRLLPGMFHPISEMPAALLEHIRYPKDFFQVQSNQLMTYHMTDPQVFYNREDQWRAPNEIYANEAQEVQPYYLIMRLPNQDREEFIQLRPFTPAQRNNLVAWLAASSDGDRYGQMLLYRFPKQVLVFGPEQIEARINQDPAISQRISLWNTQGSRAIQGNLLVIPIERSLLYVEPLYLEAEQNSLPILARVILVYRNRIVMAETLADALSAIFQGERETAPPVIRDLEADVQSLDDLLPNLIENPEGETPAAAEDNPG